MDFAQKFRYSANSIISTVLIFAIIFGINIFSKNHFTRIDLTENNLYTISDSTIDTLESLDDLVTVKVYFSEDLPPHFIGVKEEINDILSEYQAYARGNIRVRYIDPSSNEEFSTEVKSLGIPEVKMNVVGKDKLEVQSGYLGMGIFYGEKNEVIPVIQNTQNLEYELTSAITKVIRTEQKTIGFLSGHGEHGAFEINPYLQSENFVQPDYTILRAELEKNYNVKQVDLLKNEAPLDDIDTLIIAGPKETLSEYEIFLIDQHIVNGKNVIFLINAVNIQPGLLASKADDIGLNNLLKNIGISVTADIAYDQKSHASASFSQGIFNFAIPYPFWVKSAGENLSQDNPIVAYLDSVVFTWASPLTTEARDGITSETLASTTDSGGITNGNFQLDPNQKIQNQNPQILKMAVLQRGNFTSLFKDKDIPQKPVVEDEVNQENTSISSTTFDPQNKKDLSEIASSILIVGDSQSFDDRTLRNFPQNLVFALNAIDALTLDRSLIDVRAKLISQKPLDETSDSQKTFIKWFGILFAPTLVILYGFTRMHLRNRKRKLANQMFS